MPPRKDAEITACLLDQYGLQVGEIALLPQGGDINATVYRVNASDGAPYFLKLKSGPFDETVLLVLAFLSKSGIREVIAPVRTVDYQLCSRLVEFSVILSPFFEGQNAFKTPLKDEQWIRFGEALSAIHHTRVPAELTSRVKQETYSSQWRERVKMLLARVKNQAYSEPVAAQYAAFLAEKSGEILEIVQIADQLGQRLQARDPQLVLCHSDLHAGNLLIDTKGCLFIIDWDDPIMAAKERDLMFIGGGVGSAWYLPEEEALFYQGYGGNDINPVALAYYRFERIVQDIAEWGERLLLSDEGGQERVRWLSGLKRWFEPHDVVAMAYRAKKNLPADISGPSYSVV